jgi:hypothetical protein
MADAVKREPFLKVLSENVEILYGYKDGHAVVRVRLPVPLRPWYPVPIPFEAIRRFKKNFDDAWRFGNLTEAEREAEILKAEPRLPLQFEARDDCRGRWGYKDAHVELDVKRVVWFTLPFPFEEFKLAKAAMDEAYQWGELPAEVRELQGIAAA